MAPPVRELDGVSSHLRVGDGPICLSDDTGEWYVTAVDRRTVTLSRLPWYRRLINRIRRRLTWR